MVKLPSLRRGHGKDNGLTGGYKSKYERIFDDILESVGGDPDKIPRLELFGQLEVSSLEVGDTTEEEWDDFEQVDTEVYLNLKGLPQSKSII